MLREYAWTTKALGRGSSPSPSAPAPPTPQKKKRKVYKQKFWANQLFPQKYEKFFNKKPTFLNQKCKSNLSPWWFKISFK